MVIQKINSEFSDCITAEYGVDQLYMSIIIGGVVSYLSTMYTVYRLMNIDSFLVSKARESIR